MASKSLVAASSGNLEPRVAAGGDGIGMTSQHQHAPSAVPRPETDELVIRASGLRKSYGEVVAIGGIDLEVARGEVFAFLGPNAAGKTTTVEILEGYRPRDGGEVTVLGRDPARPIRDWRSRIGLVLQTCDLQPELTVRETAQLYAGFYRAPRDVEETIALVGLADKRGERVKRLSGGERRRLDVGLALVGDPELIFLDEPTTGFDPAARRRAWTALAELRALGKTIFLTTHYMEEAQALADRVAIIVAGEIAASGTPTELAAGSMLASRITFGLAREGMSDLPDLGSASIACEGDFIRIDTRTPVETLHRLTEWALARGTDLTELEVRRPTLEDVYLEVTQAR